MRHLDPLLGILPDDKLGSIRRPVQPNDDLKLALRIIQRETVQQLLLDSLTLVVCGNHNADRRLVISLSYGPAGKHAQHPEQCGVPEVHVNDEDEAEPEDGFHNHLDYSTVTLLARFRGLSTSQPRNMATAITIPSRTFTSSMFPIVFRYTLSWGTMTTTGMSESISAIGPCFISPAV